MRYFLRLDAGLLYDKEWSQGESNNSAGLLALFRDNLRKPEPEG